MVPSSGSMTQVTPVEPLRELPSSPRMPSSGRARSREPTINASLPRSSSVTRSVGLDLEEAPVASRTPPATLSSPVRRSFPAASATSCASSRRSTWRYPPRFGTPVCRPIPAHSAPPDGVRPARLPGRGREDLFRDSGRDPVAVRIDPAPPDHLRRASVDDDQPAHGHAGRVRAPGSRQGPKLHSRAPDGGDLPRGRGPGRQHERLLLLQDLPEGDGSDVRGLPRPAAGGERQEPPSRPAQADQRGRL